MAVIGVEEAGHAELAWQVAEWAEQRLPRGVRRRVVEAREREFAQLQLPEQMPPSPSFAALGSRLRRLRRIWSASWRSASCRAETSVVGEARIASTVSGIVTEDLTGRRDAMSERTRLRPPSGSQIRGA
jgi:hypothetical protein